MVLTGREVKHVASGQRLEDVGVLHAELQARVVVGDEPPALLVAPLGVLRGGAGARGQDVQAQDFGDGGGVNRQLTQQCARGIGGKIVTAKTLLIKRGPDSGCRIKKKDSTVGAQQTMYYFFFQSNQLLKSYGG